MPGRWHTDMQNLFAESQQEVEFLFEDVTPDGGTTKRRRVADVYVDETVIEYQHSRITRQEVNERNEDYGNKLGNTVAWVIDCTENTARLHKAEDDEDVWLLEFKKKWQVDSMRDCKILFAVFSDAEHGERIFRVPVESVRHRFVMVYGSWVDKQEWKAHVTSDELQGDVEVPTQSTLTVAQDPHGSGKTYRLTQMMIHTEVAEYMEYGMYSTFIILTKAHSAKEVVFVEFMRQLRTAGLEYTVDTHNNKYVAKFTRPCGAQVMCIFGTADSLMYNLCDNKVRGADLFMNLVRTVHEHGATKLQGPKGRFCYAGQQPRLNKKTLLITDEATMLPEIYIDALSTLMRTCNCDVHLAGDVQQSTYYEDNMLTRVVREFQKAADPSSLPSFPNCTVKMIVGNEVRRFNQDLVDFRNAFMGDFHEKPSHDLQIVRPVAALDVSHTRGEYSFHTIECIHAWSERDSDEVVDSAATILDRFEQDVMELPPRLPNDFIFVTPYVKNNPLMDEVQTNLHEFWGKKFYDPEYVSLVHTQAADETIEACQSRIAKYNEIDAHIESLRAHAHRGTVASLSWFCLLHRSEEGKPIDTSESEHATRIVSIHASQGDGRKVAYVVGLAEQKLVRFSGGKINLKYESLVNVAVSRQKEVIRLFMDDKYDDIRKRCMSLLPEEMRIATPPKLNARPVFRLLGASGLDLDEDLFNRVKDEVVKASPCEAPDNSRPLVDYAHHVIRMAVAHAVFWMNLVTHQAADKAVREQVLTIFRKVAKAKIKPLPSTTYYETLRDADNQKVIPVLYYDSGSVSFMPQHKRTLQILEEVQTHVCCWVRGESTDFQEFTPEHAVLLQYAVEVFTMAKYGGENIKMDHVYDIVNCYMNKSDGSDSRLQQHYDHVAQMTTMFNHIVETSGDEAWQWKIYRSIWLGKKKSGNPTQHFQFKAEIQNLFVTDTRAMPVILVPTVDETNMADICAQALLYTLVCLQPMKPTDKDKDKGIHTWEYIQDKKIEICFVPIKGSRPIFVDLTEIVEEHIVELAEWICKYARYKTEDHRRQTERIALHHKDDFAMAQDTVSDAHAEGKCPDYIRDVINNANAYEDVENKLDEKLDERLKQHLKVLRQDILRR